MNNIKIAWRNISKTKSLSFIHVFGLAIALASAIILFLTARFELSFDQFFTNADRIGILYHKSQPEQGVQHNTSMAAPAAATLKAEMPSIEQVSRVGNGNVVLRNGNTEIESSNKFVDIDFLNILDYPIEAGSQSALNDLGNIVLDESMAKRLFNQTDVIGKQVEVNLQGTWIPKTITAVLKDLPENSSLRFRSLLRFETKPDYQIQKDRWDLINHDVVVKMKDQAVNDVLFTKEVQPLVNQYYKNDIENLKKNGASVDENGAYLSLHLLPIQDFHLSKLGFSSGPTASFPWILLGLAGLIIFIASSNFINLSLANSLIRTKEIGTRKTLGGTVKQLILQLWTEAFLLCLIALLIGFFLAWMTLPQFNAMMNYRLNILGLFSPMNLIMFLSLFMLITLLAGGFPAWKIANTNIIQSLKGSSNVKTSRLRNTLSVLQFAIAILLIISTIIISSQLNFMANRPLGYNKTEVISIPIGNGIDQEDALQRMRVELGKETWVTSVSAADINIGLGNDRSSSNSVFGFEQEGKEYRTNYMRIDYDYLKTLDIQLLAGRDFDRQFATDSNSVILNKQMALKMGGVDQIIGKTINLNGKSLVIGVIDDFNFQDLRRKVEPLTISVNPHVFSVSYIFVRVVSQNLAETLDQVEAIWKKVNPKARIAASFLDQNTQNLYEDDRRFANIVLAGAGIAILISCMGLFALAMLTINKRIKEIGIRKVLGSSISNLVFLLTKDFIKLVLIAFVLAAPIAWFLMNSWLQSYAFKVDIQLWMFALSGIIALIIAWTTIAWQTIRAAKANPVDSLRDE